jgi:hypothetical protein
MVEVSLASKDNALFLSYNATAASENLSEH